MTVTIPAFLRWKAWGRFGNAIKALGEKVMPPPGGSPPQIELPNIKYLVAVASGKGGVGKSTVSTNLALALQMLGRRVGLMDADIYGPSIPLMLGVHSEGATADPAEKYGLKIMSMGFVLAANQAA